MNICLHSFGWKKNVEKNVARIDHFLWKWEQTNIFQQKNIFLRNEKKICLRLSLVILLSLLSGTISVYRLSATIFAVQFCFVWISESTWLRRSPKTLFLHIKLMDVYILNTRRSRNRYPYASQNLCKSIELSYWLFFVSIDWDCHENSTQLKREKNGSG